MRLDHLVLAVPDLAAGIARIAELTGTRPTPGGRHVGLGTANALLGLGSGAYLEIVGPDPDDDVGREARPFGVDPAITPRLVTWAVRSHDLDADVEAARGEGHDPGAARDMSRRTPDGALLAWRLTLAEDGRDTGVVPFVIDWLDTPHPTSALGADVRLTDFEVHTPDVARVGAALRALRCDVPVREADADGLMVRLSTPRGQVTLT